jgi:hypothetical protein
VGGIGRRGAAPLLGAALWATGCTGSGRDAGPPGTSRAPPATRSPAYGKPCLQAEERATAVLVAATRIRPPVAGAISLSGAAVFDDLDARAAVGRLRVPGLFMAAQKDRPFAEAARGLYGAAGGRGRRLPVLSSAAHGTNLLSFGGEAAAARAVLRRFVAAHPGPTA